MEHFVEIDGLSDADAAARIHADGIDILVDLNGYTQRARTEIPAMRPAPVQVNFLGYPGTTGAAFFDYILADRFVIRKEDFGGYSEKPARMPACYAPNDRRRSVGEAQARPGLGLPQAGLVFCCFNQAFKILPEVFTAWMRILHAVPGSVLWLLEGHPLGSANLRREAGKHGIDPARLVISPTTSPELYLGRLRAADLFLDTFPYNAHTTAADALWVGLPVLTRAGDTFASRVAGSMLMAAGLPELVTTSAAQYEALAVQLARAPGELAALRARLGAHRSSAALFDTAGFTRSLEVAYERMAKLYRAGSAPQPITL
jgi:predicted O-linked N-acetylglucosamine transferase (SPINDLY family)